MQKMKRIIDTYGVSKCGFAIDIEQTKDKFFDAGQVHFWEGRYWNIKEDRYNEVDPLYVAPIDTTFCLHKKSRIIEEMKRSRNGIPSTTALRIAGRFTCQHMGWWAKQPLEPEEERYYNSTQEWASTYKEKVKLGYHDENTN